MLKVDSSRRNIMGLGTTSPDPNAVHELDEQ